MQLTIYLDDETEAVAKSAAAGQGLSLSRWVCQAIREKSLSEWPADVRALAGAFQDWPEVQRNYGQDAPREQLD